MTTHHAVPAWFAPVAVVALAGAMLLTAALAHADSPKLVDRVERYLEHQHSAKDPIVEPAELAVAITNATPSREWAALLLTIAKHESAYSARIAAGACRPRECDHGLAWGLWQVHKMQQTSNTWGSPDLTVQARAASHLARGAFDLCKTSKVPFPLATLRAYASGRGCDHVLKDEQQRVATYNQILSQL